MAFTLPTWSRTTASANEPIDLLQDNDYIGGPRVYTYVSIDTQAEIAADGYFGTPAAPGVSGDLVTGDIILSYSITDGTWVWLSVTNSNSYATPYGGTITTGAFSSASPVGTANITNNAVTYAKIQEAAAHTIIGNPTGVLADVEEITLDPTLAFSGTTLKVAPAVQAYASGAITAAQWNGMFAAPLQIVAAPGANLGIIIDKFELNMTFVTAEYAAGGVVALQYENTVHGAGVAASQTVAAASINGIAANSFLALTGVTAVTATATVVNQGVFLSNQTGAFTTGDGTWTWNCWYRIVPTA